MTRKELWMHRLKIAQAIATGKTQSEVARLFRVGRSPIRAGCREFLARHQDELSPLEQTRILRAIGDTREQRRERMKKIAQAIAAGEDPHEVAETYGVQWHTVVRACRNYFRASSENMSEQMSSRLKCVIRFSREKKRQRRKKMSEAALTGKTLHQIAAEFGVSVTTVVIACKEFSVPLPPPTTGVYQAPRERRHGNNRVTLKQWKAVDWEQYDAAIARKLHITRERVRQVRRSLGMPPSRRPVFAPGLSRFREWVKRNGKRLSRMNVRDVAHELGSPQSSIARWGKSLGIQLREWKSFPKSLTRQSIHSFVHKRRIEEGGCWEWIPKYRPPWPYRRRRLVYEIFHGSPPNGTSVLTRCENRNCVNPKHLYCSERRRARAVS